MSSFTDYYTLLGVSTDASASEIKAAFKKQALLYHPDVYKGSDAQERTRLLLLAYKTLSDSQTRREYDAQHSEHSVGAPPIYRTSVGGANRPGSAAKKAEVSPHARRDRKRHYAFPNLDSSAPVKVQLGDVSYRLSHEQANELRAEGLLRGVAPGASGSGINLQYHPQAEPDALDVCYCHRCQHRWTPNIVRGRIASWDRVCPSCSAKDWAEYLLLRCVHCSAVFESEQIRYEIGGYNYGDGDLCPPYELFPLCPYCSSPNWCPAEDARVAVLRAAAARKAATLRLIWLGIAVVMIVALGFLFTTTFAR